MENYGIDVSTYNGTIDWAKVKKDKHGTFAIIKATQGKSIYSLIKRRLFTDSKFKRNITEAAKHNVPIGVYHYLTASNVAEAIEEANYFLKVIEPYKKSITLYAAVDVEEDSIFAKLTKAQNTKIVNTFCEYVAAAGYKPIIYTNRNYLTYRLNKDDIIDKYDVWQAHWSKNKPTDCGDKLKIWQYGTTNVNGIKGDTDGNIAYFDPNTAAPFKKGDKVRIKKGAKYGGNSSGTGKKIPDWAIGKVYTIANVYDRNKTTEALIEELYSWVGITYLEKVV